MKLCVVDGGGCGRDGGGVMAVVMVSLSCIVNEVGRSEVIMVVVVVGLGVLAVSNDSVGTSC